MNVVYQKKFLKQLAQIPSTTRIKIEKFAFEDLPVARSIAELGVIEKMQGYDAFYKARFGSYRVGIKTEGDHVILKVVMGSSRVLVEPLNSGGDCEANRLIYRYGRVALPPEQRVETGRRGQFHRNPRRTGHGQKGNL